jgi:hypothetical protein
MVFELCQVLETRRAHAGPANWTAWMAARITDLGRQRGSAHDSAPNSAEIEEPDAVEYLCYEIFRYRKAAKRRFIVGRFLLSVGIGASVLGIVNSTTGWLAPDAWTSVLAAVPGVVLLLMQIFKYDAGAEWHKRKQQSLEALYKSFVFDGASTEDASALLAIISEELDSARGPRGSKSRHPYLSA